MPARPLLLVAAALGLVAGCNKPPSSSTPEGEPGTSAPSTEARPAQPAGNEPGTGTPGGEAKPGERTVFIVRNSGIRCIAPPCPTYLAQRADKPDMDAVPVHELDLSVVAGSSEERQQSLLQQTEMAEGLKVEGSLRTQPNAGPAGDATVLRVEKLVGG